MKITIEDDTDLSGLNGLTPEEKILIVRAYTMIAEAKEKLRRRGTDISLPYRIQLKSDFGEIHRLTKKFRPGRDNTKHRKKMDFLLTRMKTEMDHIF